MPSNNSLLTLVPNELVFNQVPSNKGKESYVAKLKLVNNTAEAVGFKFKTNAPVKYSVKPVLGAVLAGDAVEIMVKSDAKVSPSDKFLIQTLHLTEEQVATIDNSAWKDLDRSLLSESFIDCKLGTTLSEQAPQPTKESSRPATVVRRERRRGYTSVCLLITALLVLAIALLVPYQTVMDYVDEGVKLAGPYGKQVKEFIELQIKKYLH